ncbi:hypothetical protein GN316_21090 [Xylophilus sp. Kf1]|nr:hypothetical protein [Xylophilus sp. Kf1]
MEKASTSNLAKARDVFATDGLASGLEAIASGKRARDEMSRAKIATAIRRLALMELGQLSEEQVPLAFTVAPNILNQPASANWRIFVAPDVSAEARQALLNAQTHLQERWNMVDVFQDTRALIV